MECRWLNKGININMIGIQIICKRDKKRSIGFGLNGYIPSPLHCVKLKTATKRERKNKASIKIRLILDTKNEICRQCAEISTIFAYEKQKMSLLLD